MVKWNICNVCGEINSLDSIETRSEKVCSEQTSTNWQQNNEGLCAQTKLFPLTFSHAKRLDIVSF